MERIRIGNNIAISWAVYDLNGRIHNLEGKDIQLYMAVGGYKVYVNSYTIQGNVISWVFLGSEQNKTGDYKLVLEETDPLSGTSAFDVRAAFRLTPEDVVGPDIVLGPANVSVQSVLTYSNLVGIESIDVVESSEDSGDNIVTLHLIDGSFAEVVIKNGSKGPKGDTGATGATGAKGDKGDIGERGPAGIDFVVASIGTNDPTQAPSVDKDLTDGVLSLTFNNIKGQKGDKGDQGNTGSSVDYPYELVNNVTTDDATKGLSAAQGVVLDDKIGQLGQYLDNPEWIKVVTDSEDKILYGVKTDGRFYFGNGCPPQVAEYIQDKIKELSLDEYEDIVTFLGDLIDGDTLVTLLNAKLDKEGLDADALTTVRAVDNPEYIQVTTDSEGKVLGGRKQDGTVVENVGIEVKSIVADTINADEATIETANINSLNLSEAGINSLVNDLEEHGIAADGVTQEELTQQLSNYVQNATLGSYETKQELNQTLEGYVKDTDSVSNIANGAVTVSALSQAVQDLISAGGEGTITNNPDDVTLETNSNNQLQIKRPYKIRGAQGTGGDANGDARALCATDFQLSRADGSQVAGGDYSFIAGGRNNKIYSDVRMGQNATECHAEGKNNIANSWQAHVEGSRCISDAKIGHAEGNASICSTNDGHAEGNRTVAGRVRFDVSSYGTEDAGGNLGILNYVVIPASNGDVTAYFPNALITDAYVTQHYGSTSQKDSQGNIYNSPFTPAVWDGDTLVRANDLTWALHNVCIVRGQGESDICYAKIKKAVYDSSTGTKIYFVPDDVYAVYSAIYSSYAPQVQIDGFRLGNGGHSEGYITQCAGYGAHSEGYITKANGDGSHAEGASTQAIATSTHAEGELTIASKLGAHAQGIKTTASGRASFSMGAGSVASRDYQLAYSAHEVEEDRGKRQTCGIMYDNTYADHGWHTIPLLKRAERNKTYCIETTLLGRQTAGVAGNIGDTFAYKVTVLASIDSSGGFTPIASSSELIGRSSEMSGDGVSSGVRISVYNNLYDGDIIARLDSIDGATFRVTGYTKWIEIFNE